MRVISDIEIHSKYSRACSRDLTPENIVKWAAIKGVNLVGTGDFTHPLWRSELKAALEEAEPGFYKLRNPPLPNLPPQGGGSKSNFPPLVGGIEGGVRFILSAEISCIYSRGGKLRRVHLLIYVPSFAAAEKFCQSLERKGGKLESDGRPILGMDAEEVLKMLLEADPGAMMIPAHVWTPYFGLFGSKSGFDSVEEAFGDMTQHIYALETGLSSDPEMNWRISANDKFTLVSSSDAHSLPRIGREANVMEIEDDKFSYQEFMRIIKEKDSGKFKFTIEYFPEEGKYHLDGHADCKQSFLPAQTKKLNGRCPVCSKLLTVGVLSRVQELADCEEGFVPDNAIPARHLVPLEEVLAECFGVKPQSKKVQGLYWQLIKAAGNEFTVILDLPVEELKKVAGEAVAEAVRRVREEKVEKIAGYDGVYGVMKIFTDEEREKFAGKIGRQTALF